AQPVANEDMSSNPKLNKYSSRIIQPQVSGSLTGNSLWSRPLIRRYVQAPGGHFLSM
ncbi:hypothetical protein KI387_014408, partial [Taxus chinensis]